VAEQKGFAVGGDFHAKKKHRNFLREFIKRLPTISKNCLRGIFKCDIFSNSFRLKRRFLPIEPTLRQIFATNGVNRIGLC